MTPFAPGPHYWWPVLQSAALGHKAPVSALLNAVPLVLFRDQHGKPAALLDRCPHRSAPLSQGRCVTGQIQCPYHGWTFDHQGRCTRVPGAEHTGPAQVQDYACTESTGLIWVRPEPGATDTPPRHPDQCDSFLMEACAEGTLLELAENFLEPFHTHFVHAGLVRRDRQRQTVLAQLRPIAGGIEVEYSGEQPQNGWLSRWLEGSRGNSWGRFYWPNRAQIEYRDQRGRLTLQVDAWFTPQADNQHKIFARVTTRRGLWPAWLKQQILRRLFGAVLRQDLAITRAVSQNRQRFRSLPGHLLPPAPLDAPHDLMGPALRQLLQHGSNSAIEARSLTLMI